MPGKAGPNRSLIAPSVVLSVQRASRFGKYLPARFPEGSARYQMSSLTGRFERLASSHIKLVRPTGYSPVGTGSRSLTLLCCPPKRTTVESAMANGTVVLLQDTTFLLLW